MKVEEVEGGWVEVVWSCGGEGGDAEMEARGGGKEQVNWTAEAKPAATREEETHGEVMYAQQASHAQCPCRLMSSYGKPWQ